MAAEMNPYFTTNLAESFMSILALINFGKHKNFIQGGEFTIRSFVAALKYNEGIEWSLIYWEKYFDMPTSAFVQEIEMKKNKQSYNASYKTS